MEVKDYIDKIKFQLTGGIIDCELDDKGIEKVINMSLEEMKELMHKYPHKKIIPTHMNDITKKDCIFPFIDYNIYS